MVPACAAGENVLLVNFSAEAIAHTCLRENVSRLRRVLFDFSPQLSQLYTHVVFVSGGVAAPHTFENLPMGQDTPGMFDKCCEEFVL